MADQGVVIYLLKNCQLQPMSDTVHELKSFLEYMKSFHKQDFIINYMNVSSLAIT